MYWPTSPRIVLSSSNYVLLGQVFWSAVGTIRILCPYTLDTIISKLDILLRRFQNSSCILTRQTLDFSQKHIILLMHTDLKAWPLKYKAITAIEGISSVPRVEIEKPKTVSILTVQIRWRWIRVQAVEAGEKDEFKICFGSRNDRTQDIIVKKKRKQQHIQVHTSKVYTVG